MAWRNEARARWQPGDDMPPDWEPRVCSNVACRVKTWYVKRHPALSDTWWVAESALTTPATVVARTPLCPHCGVELLSAVELEEGVGAGEAGVGPLFDWLREQGD